MELSDIHYMADEADAFDNGMPQRISALLSSLNAEQREAVETQGSNMLIIAGAGSGKTHALTTRIATTIMRGVHPSCIMAITFTNKSAKEMVARVAKLLPEMAVQLRSMWIGTFHGISGKIIREHAELAGLTRDFQILDSVDQRKFINEIVSQYGLDKDIFVAKNLASFINQAKENGLRPIDVTYGDPEDIRFYELYENERRANDLVDFAEMMLCCYEILRDNPEIRDLYQQKLRHLMIDEFQDTNILQYKWVKLLSHPDFGSEDTTVFAVGDDAQSIYAFRGANVRNMFSFQDDYSAHLVKLERNYRSVGNILDAANEVIGRNEGQYKKNLWTDREGGDSIELLDNYDDRDEARSVVTHIAEMMKSKYITSWSEVAILYRTKKQYTAFEQQFMGRSIPYIVTGGLRFTEREEVRHTLGYLRLAINRNANLDFARVMNVPARGLGEKLLKDIKLQSFESRQSYYTSALPFAVADKPTKRTIGLQSFFACLDDITEIVKQPLSLWEKIRRTIERSGLEAHYKQQLAAATSEEDQEQMRKKLHNLELFADYGAIFEKANETADVAEFLNSLTLDDDMVNERERGQKPEAVQLMTIHAAKGLEFPVVFIVGMESGLFPSFEVTSQHAVVPELKEELEEERRLMYVGLTRAGRRLYLSYARKRMVYGKIVDMRVPSNFMYEIAAIKKNLDEIKAKEDKVRAAQRG